MLKTQRRVKCTVYWKTFQYLTKYFKQYIFNSKVIYFE